MFLDEYITANKGLSQRDNPVILKVDSKKKVILMVTNYPLKCSQILEGVKIDTFFAKWVN
jgi:hypothetical protein